MAGCLKHLAVLMVLVLSASISSPAQRFIIDKVEHAGDDIILYYQLLDSITNRSYTINLYASTDNYINPLTKVTGDLGLEVKPGGNRKITWHAKEELGADFKGEVSLEVRGKVYIPFVKMDGLEDFKNFKLRKNYKITWTGGRENQVLNFDLYRKDKKVTTFPNIANVGQYNLKFDNVKPGGQYRFRISDVRNKDEVVITEPFKIKRKVPLMVKVLAVIGLGYLISESLPGSEDDNSIPEPIKPGGN
jgi:hypothetical protein